MPPGAITYKEVADKVRTRLDLAQKLHHQLVEDVNFHTNGEFERDEQKTYSAASRANVDGIDWRVPRLIYCKDPKFNNAAIDPAFAFDVQQRKMKDADVLERQLGDQAAQTWNQTWNQTQGGIEFVQAQVYAKPKVPFVEAHPNYCVQDDKWDIKLDLRSFDEAMRDDLHKPMPRPSLFAEDHENFVEGKYIKNDCPIT